MNSKEIKSIKDKAIAAGKQMTIGFCYLLSVVVLFPACSKDGDDSDSISIVIPETPVYNDGQVDNSLKLNQLQYLSSHNSYRKHTDKIIYNFLTNFSGLLPYNLMEWEYDHVNIYTQLEEYGVRHIELDIYADSEGGKFYNRLGYKLTARDEASNVEALKQPGLKILHIPDVDFETHNYTFIDALQEVKRWSDKYENHLPVYIMIEAKTETVGDYLSFLGFVKAEPWTDENIASIEKEILQVFPREQIIKPDDVRGSRSTLRDAVLNDGWPTIGASRGKVMFLLDGADFSKQYKGSNANLAGKLIFTNASPGDPDAAFIKRNDPDSIDVESLVKQGFLVRSMIGGVYQARSGDYSKFEMAKAKGVHFLSTDYYKPDERAGIVEGWTDFTIKLENHSYRINPVTK